jgi:glutathione S-transferase
MHSMTAHFLCTQVPAVTCGDEVVVESLVINEYLVEKFGAKSPTPLMPGEMSGGVAIVAAHAHHVLGFTSAKRRAGTVAAFVPVHLCIPPTLLLRFACAGAQRTPWAVRKCALSYSGLATL